MHENRIILQLQARGISVMTLDPGTIDGVLEAILLTGAITNREESADKLVDSMTRQMIAITDKTGRFLQEERPETFYVVWHEPLKTAGSGTLQDELINKAGGRNIAWQLKDYADISLEIVVMENPSVIIAGTRMGSGQDQTLQYILTEPRLSDIKARLNGHVYSVDADLSSRAGPRIIDALEIFASLIHPDLFR
jgi:iron complex transport system substrate-binding protein